MLSVGELLLYTVHDDRAYPLRLFLLVDNVVTVMYGMGSGVSFDCARRSSWS